MKKIILGLFLLGLTQVASATLVTLKINHTNNKSGKIAIAIFNDDRDFPNSGSILQLRVPVSSAQNSAEVKVELPEGHYAVAFFLDENGNNKMDKNILGIPKERFGFSNDPSILTGAPSFNECEINVSDENNEFSMKLIKLL